MKSFIVFMFICGILASIIAVTAVDYMEGNQRVKHVCKYTIWVGSSVVSSGYDTESFQEEDDKVTFTTCNTGKTKIIFRHSVVSIDVNL